MSDGPQPLSDAQLSGDERIRVGRRMMDPTTQVRTGPVKVWTTSVLDIIRYARRVSPTVKALALSAAGSLTFTTTDGVTKDLGSVAGPAGRDGIDGRDGAPGKDGVAGLPGKDGAPGANGKDGAAGVAGRDGVNGKDGAAGAAGTPGAAGKDGAQGVAGKDGAQGLPGKDGAAGAAGTNGTNGKDGAAGIVPIYDAIGLVPLPKMWIGKVATDTNGNWSADMTKAGFTAAPNVQANALSADQTPAAGAQAVVMTPSTAEAKTIARGAVMLPQTTTLGSTLAALLGVTVVPNKKAGAGVIVMVQAVGI